MANKTLSVEEIFEEIARLDVEELLRRQRQYERSKGCRYQPPKPGECRISVEVPRDGQ